ncbi:50S ribosomal protein L6 [Candidatus Woesearchaeota archaeon]|nr:50S ribosomal protein L6 [Candidatus Woesearchaeota archaeon]
MKKEKNIRKEISVPESVSASLNGQLLSVKGAKGNANRALKHHNISVKIDDKKIIIESQKMTKESKKLIGSLTAHVKNMIKGCSQSYIYTLKICSGHFPMNVSISGRKFVVKNFLGEKVPRTLQLKEGAEVKVEGDIIHVTSVSKETAGQVSADIEQLTRRPGYDSRIFQDGIYLVNRDGKELK